MRPAGKLDRGNVPTEQGVDVDQMLPDRDFVALPFVTLLPLIMIVKNQGDYVVEPFDEAIGRGGIYQTVESAVEIGEVPVAKLDLLLQQKVFLPEFLQLTPMRRTFRQCREGQGRAQ